MKCLGIKVKDFINNAGLFWHESLSYLDLFVFRNFKNQLFFMKQKLPITMIAGMLSAWAAGLVLLFVMKKKAAKEERPPKNAPQLDIENPGNQSEFLTTATESEVG